MTRDDWHDQGFAADWDEAGNLLTNPDRLRQLALIADMLASSQPTHVLDLGIGSAQVEAVINHRHPNFFEQCRVTGIDASEAMLKMARHRCEGEKLSNIELVRADFASIEKIELAQPPDAVICVQALHETPHAVKRKIFAWVHEHLPAGCPFYILDRYEYSIEPWLCDWQATWNWMSSFVSQDVLDFDEYHRRYRAKMDYVTSVDDYRTWLEQAGFETLCPYRCFNRAMIIARAESP